MDSDQGKLFIGGISWETTDDKLREHFSQYGDVAQTAVMRDKTTGRPRGFGFVVFSDPSVLDVVLQNQHTIDGRTVEAKRALSREEQQSNPRSGFNNTDRSTGGTRTKKIFVGGLPSTLTEEEFRQYFETYGTVTDVVIMFDQNTQRPRGFGFISFEAESSVDRVLHKTYHDLNGKKVEVKRALPKDANNGGNRGNSGYGGGSYQGYSGSAGSDSSYDGQMDASRYMQPPGSGGAFPSYGSSGYGGAAAAYGYGPASSGMGYGGYSSYGGAPQAGGRGGPWGSQGPSGYGAMGYGNGAPGSAPSGQAPSGVAGYGSQGYGYAGYMGGADGGGYGALGGRYGSSPSTAAARGHGGVEMQGNNNGGYAGSGYGDVNGNTGNGNAAAWRSDPSHAPGSYGSSGTYGGGYQAQ